MAFDIGGLIGGIGQAAGSLLSPILGYASARKTNQSNEKIASETNSTNAKSVSETNEMNRQIAEQTNATNRAIAEQNLGFQRELQEYNKALQERIFEREDTSYQRTAEDMLAAGLNPLDMQGTNGAGEVVSQSALNNDFQAQIGAPMQARHDERFEQADAFQSAMGALSAYASASSAIDSIKSGNLQRDAIALDNDKKFLENMARAHELGIDYKGLLNGSTTGWRKLRKQKLDQVFFTPDGKTIMDTPEWKNSAYSGYAEGANKNRELTHKMGAGIYDTDTDFERILTAISDWVNNGRGENEWKKLQETFPILKAFNMMSNN